MLMCSQITRNLFDKSMLVIDEMSLCDRSNSQSVMAAKFDRAVMGIFVSSLCDRSRLQLELDQCNVSVLFCAIYITHDSIPSSGNK